MATPSIAASVYAPLGSSAASVDVTSPGGMTTGHLDLIAIAMKAAGSGKTIATPSGYTQAFQGDHSSSNQRKIAVFWRAAEASPATASIALTDSSDISRAGIVRMSVANADLTTPINVQASAVESFATVAPDVSPTFTQPALTTTDDECLAIALCYWDSSYIGGEQGSRYAVSGWTIGAMNHCIPSAGSASNPSAVIASKAIPTAGSTGTAVFDPADHANTTQQIALSFMLAIAPAAGGPPPAIVRPRVVIF